MTDIANKPNQQTLDEAAEWFVEFREADLDTVARQAFNQWLRRSPEHIAAYLEVAAFWADVSNVATKEDIDVAALISYAKGEDNVIHLDGAGPAPRRDKAKAADSATMSKPTLPTSSAPAIGTWMRGLLAASFAIAVVGLAAWNISLRDTYRTDVGEQRSVLLKDGSTVELNAKSRLRVRFTDTMRAVELLEGQALFSVAKDSQRAFVVSSGDASVRAVGTRFDVYRKSSGTVVTVIEGRVAVADAGAGASAPVASAAASGSSAASVEQRDEANISGAASVAVLLSAGQQIIIGTSTPAVPEPADILAATAWTQRQIVFQGTPLGEVVEEFNRYNPRQLVILDETLRGVRVSGVFSSTEPASLLRFLREQVHLEITETDERVQISRR